MGYWGVFALGLAISLPALSANQTKEIQLHESVDSAHHRLLARDLQRLQRHSAGVNVPELNTLLKRTANGPALAHWIADRAKYIVDESFSFERNIRNLGSYAYDNPDVFPTSEDPGADRTQAIISNATVIMSNNGAEQYLLGKQARRLHGLRWERRTLQITSPRVGLLSIGPGLFHRSFAINRNDSRATANTIRRLGVLAHEARHSDGNGLSLGFVHATCPADHEHSGLPACDDNANGPYSVEGYALKWLSESCQDCSPAEKENLRLQYLEALSRVSEDPNAHLRLQALEELLRFYRQQLQAISEGPQRDQLLARIATAEQQHAELTAQLASDRTWDETPEGRF